MASVPPTSSSASRRIFIQKGRVGRYNDVRVSQELHQLLSVEY